MDFTKREEIAELLADEVSIILGIPKEKVKGDVPLNDLGFDSLSFVEVLVAIENKCSILLMETELNKNDFRTIDALADRIYAVKNSK